MQVDRQSCCPYLDGLTTINGGQSPLNDEYSSRMFFLILGWRWRERAVEQVKPSKFGSGTARSKEELPQSHRGWGWATAAHYSSTTLILLLGHGESRPRTGRHLLNKPALASRLKPWYHHLSELLGLWKIHWSYLQRHDKGRILQLLESASGSQSTS